MMSSDLARPSRRAARRARRRRWWRVPLLVFVSIAIVAAVTLYVASDAEEMQYRVEGTLLLTRADLDAARADEPPGQARFGAPELAATLTDGRTDLPTRQAEIVDGERLRLVVTDSAERSADEELEVAIEEARAAMPWGYDVLVLEQSGLLGLPAIGQGTLLHVVRPNDDLGWLGVPDAEFVARTVQEEMSAAEVRRGIFEGIEGGEVELSQAPWEDAPIWDLVVTADDADGAQVAYDRAFADLQERAPAVQGRVGYPESVRSDVVELSRSAEPQAMVEELLSSFFVLIVASFALLVVAMLALVRAVAPAEARP